jgi:flavin reductase (DIM6/NTAB) family NADH-FMN oxidoreductase RutF
VGLPEKEKLITLDTTRPIWERFFTVAPLVVIGTKEGQGYDLAPKHMAMPLGHGNYFGFVCTPRHSTYHNVKEHGSFTVSFPRPDQVVTAALAASPRTEESSFSKPVVEALPTFPARKIDAPFVKGSYLYLECSLHRIVDGFGDNSLICGKIIAAYVEEDSLRISDKEDQELIADAPLLVYLAYGRFARVSNSLAFPLPKDFKV